MIGLMRTLVACLLWSALQGSVPGVPQIPAPPSTSDSYGPAEPADLWDLSAGLHTHHPARTKGVLGVLENQRGQTFFDLREKGGHVVIVAALELGADVNRLVGRRVEVVGLVRELVENQGTCRISATQSFPQSYCDDPGLPPKPDITEGRQFWPRISVTIWAISDITALQRGAEAPDLTEVFDAPVGQKISVRGQFVGANLDKGLSVAAPEARAWVLRSGDQAIWVVGKEPRGNGFTLDSTYHGDIGKWLVVEGRMALCGTTHCLRASAVALAAPPKADVE